LTGFALVTDTEKLNALPVVPLILAPLTTGATAAPMTSFTVPVPLNPLFASFAVTVTV
jgi:hypothetical protein